MDLKPRGDGGRAAGRTIIGRAGVGDGHVTRAGGRADPARDSSGVADAQGADRIVVGQSGNGDRKGRNEDDGDFSMGSLSKDQTLGS